jgi:hypothetical protein
MLLEQMKLWFTDDERYVIQQTLAQLLKNSKVCFQLVYRKTNSDRKNLAWVHCNNTKRLWYSEIESNCPRIFLHFYSKHGGSNLACFELF